MQDSPRNLITKSLNYLKKCAFTLAEVLIVIGIIGVVAAITIPTLVSKYQEKQTVTALKKVYSTLSQAFILAETTNGKREYWDWGTEEERATGALNILNIVAPHLKVIKNCGISTTDVCFGYVIKNLKGTPVTPISSWSRAILADGVSIAIYSYANNCSQARGTTTELSKTCGYVFVDINSEKKPNQYGKDLFFFTIGKNSIIPFGVKDDTNDPISNCATTEYGWACAGWVIYKENLDYLRRNVSWDE